jgi:hypothetical protein
MASFLTYFTFILANILGVTSLNTKHITTYLFAVQGIGAIFFVVVLGAYVFGLRATTSNVVLHSDPIFRTVLSIFGGLLLLTTGVAIVFSYAARSKSKEPSPA